MREGTRTLDRWWRRARLDSPPRLHFSWGRSTLRPLALCITFCAVNSSESRSTTLYVGGPGGFSSIPAAFQQAVPGDTILVRDGTYVLSNFAWGSVDANITLKSEHGRAACSLIASTGTRLFTIASAAGTTLGGAGHGFTLSGGNPGGLNSDGGAILVSGVSDLLIEDCAFVSNHSATRGGALCIENGWTGSIVSSSFQGNTCGGAGDVGGGALVVLSEGHWSMDGCDFRDNHVTYAGTGSVGGGALYARSTSQDTRIVGCVFAHNSLDGGPATTGTTKGGAVMLAPDYAGVLSRNTFEYNTAVEGGAVYVWRNGISPVLFSEFEGNVFYANHALLDGGALRTDHAPGAWRLPIANCRFEYNVAERYGGACFLWHTTQDMQSCTFLRNQANTAGGALWIDLRGTPVDNSFSGLSFVENSALLGAGVATGRALTSTGAISLNLSASIFAYNQGPAFSELTSTDIAVALDCCDSFGNEGNGPVATCSDCFSLDPEFCASVAGLLSLQSGSPCLPGNHPGGSGCPTIGAYGVGCTSFIDTSGCLSTWLNAEAVTANYSMSDSLLLRCQSNPTAVGLLWFSGVSLPTGATVDSAMIWAGVTRANGSTAPALYPCLRSSIRSQATWFVYRTGSGWGAPGAGQPGVDYSIPAVGAGLPLVEGFVQALGHGPGLGSWVTGTLVPSGTAALVIRSSGLGEASLWACPSGEGPTLRVWYHE